MRSVHLRRTSAFTLIEILVVVAIIAVLIGILLPGLGAARAQARTLVCKTRLRAWAQGIAVYASTYNGCLPMDSASSNAGIDGSSAKAMGVWNEPQLWFNGVGQIVAGSAYSDLQTGKGPLPRPGGNSMFVCPESIEAAPGNSASDAVVNGCFTTTGWIGTPDNVAAYTIEQRPMLVSYGMCSKIRNIDYDYHGTRVPASRGKVNDASRLSRLEPVATAVLMAEKRINPNELYKNDANYGAALTPNAVDPTRFTARHKKGGNIAFADAHVEYFTNAQVNLADTVNAQFPVQFNQRGLMIWNWQTGN